MRSLVYGAIVLALVGGGGCRSKIGDSCRRSTDCSLQGDRTCDLSNRVNGRGECIIEGCGRDSCPKEAACVKSYGSDFLSVSCDPEREDISVVDANGVALPPLDACLSHEVCLPEGLCADEVSARTTCRRKCSSGRDCRGGYECRLTGTRGVYHTPDPEDPTDLGQIRICMPE